MGRGLGLQLPMVVLWVTHHLKQPHRKLLSGVVSEHIVAKLDAEHMPRLHVPHSKLLQTACLLKLCACYETSMLALASRRCL